MKSHEGLVMFNENKQSILNTCWHFYQPRMGKSLQIVAEREGRNACCPLAHHTCDQLSIGTRFVVGDGRYAT